jgi:hypothetical protein
MLESILQKTEYILVLYAARERSVFLDRYRQIGSEEVIFVMKVGFSASSLSRES